MEVGCLHPNAGIDQHFRCLDAVGLDRHARHDGADASKPFAPTFQASCPPPHGSDTSAPGNIRQIAFTFFRLIAWAIPSHRARHSHGRSGAACTPLQLQVHPTLISTALSFAAIVLADKPCVASGCRSSPL